MEASTAGTQRQYIGEATASDLRFEFKSDESDDGLLELSETNKYHTGEAGGFISALKGHFTSLKMRKI